MNRSLSGTNPHRSNMAKQIEEIQAPDLRSSAEFIQFMKSVFDSIKELKRATISQLKKDRDEYWLTLALEILTTAKVVDCKGILLSVYSIPSDGNCAADAEEIRKELEKLFS